MQSHTDKLNTFRFYFLPNDFPSLKIQEMKFPNHCIMVAFSRAAIFLENYFTHIEEAGNIDNHTIRVCVCLPLTVKQILSFEIVYPIYIYR